MISGLHSELSELNDPDQSQADNDFGGNNQIESNQ